jgi:hypothetical protein
MHVMLALAREHGKQLEFAPLIIGVKSLHGRQQVIVGWWFVLRL